MRNAWIAGVVLVACGTGRGATGTGTETATGTETGTGTGTETGTGTDTDTETAEGPKAVSPMTIAALASSTIAGRVVIDSEAPLYASERAAKEDGGPTRAMRYASAEVVRDLGAVVEIETEADYRDCVRAHDLGYELRVFVPRARLVARVTRPLTKIHADGTGWLLAAGAPVEPHDDGVVRPDDGLLGAAGAVADVDALAFGIDPTAAGGSLPPAGVPATCADPYAEEQARLWEEEARAEAEAARAEAEAEAEVARKKCEAERAAKRRRAKPAPPGVKVVKIVPQEPPCSAAVSEGGRWHKLEREYEEEPPATCALVDDEDAPALMVDGRAAIEPRSLGWREYTIERAGRDYLVTIQAGCGAVRFGAVEANLRGAGGGLVGGMGPPPRPRLEPVSGARVTWVDGTPAGTYVGGHSFDERELRRDGGRACFALPPVVGELCHRAQDLRPVKP